MAVLPEAITRVTAVATTPQGHMYKLASGNCYESVKTANAVKTLKYLSVTILPLTVVHSSVVVKFE
jgi:hypothetical protein